MNLVVLLIDLGQGLAWGALAIALLALGEVVVDRLTPGNLGELIYVQHNRNAAVVLGSGVLAVGAIVMTSILTSSDGFLAGLITAGVYGVLGIGLLALSFVVADKLTPGELGEIVVAEEPTPAAWVIGANHLAVGAIVAAAIS